MKFVQTNGVLINLDYIVSIFCSTQGSKENILSIVFKGRPDQEGEVTWNIYFKTQEERSEAYKDIQVFIRHPEASILHLG